MLALLGHGLTNIQIGEALFISPPTVKVHVSHILDKLGVKSRTEAALRAVQIGEPTPRPTQAQIPQRSQSDTPVRIAAHPVSLVGRCKYRFEGGYDGRIEL